MELETWFRERVMKGERQREEASGGENTRKENGREK